MTPSEVESNSEPCPTTGCWLWNGSVNQHGYGFVTRPVRRYAHRASWEAHAGAIPAGMHVLHLCDVPACVNPAHLVLGDQAENMRQMRARGRYWGGFRNLPPAGERNAFSKLTAEQVREIRSVPMVRGSGQKLAAQYGVTDGCISSVRRGRAWKHI